MKSVRQSALNSATPAPRMGARVQEGNLSAPSRRELLSAAVALVPISVALQPKAAHAGLLDFFGGAEEPAPPKPEFGAGFDYLYDKTLAYSFIYPTQNNKGEKLNLAFSRRPEKYSSAAPLTADARQRIVCELVDLKNAFTITISVGSPSPIVSGKPAAEWKPRETAESVLIDKSTARVSTGQRVALNSIEDLKTEEKEGVRYIVYEHISQGSPSRLSPGAKETYRHALSVTAVREGSDGTPYLYTMNIACPDEFWDSYEEGIRKAIASFKLEATGRDYVPPNKDPWMFI